MKNNKSLIRVIHSSVLSAVLTMFFLLILPSLNFGLTATEILTQIKETQTKIKDLQSYYNQTTESPLLGSTPITEQGRFIKKGNNIRKEIQSPDKKLSITTPEFIYEKDEKTGQEKKIDLKSLPQNPMAKPMTAEEALDRFQFTIESETPSSCILIGESQENTISTKLKITIDKTLMSSTKLTMFINGKEMMTVINEYITINDIPVLTKSTSTITMQIGKKIQEIKTKIEYKGIKINQGISDSLFKI